MKVNASSVIYKAWGEEREEERRSTVFTLTIRDSNNSHKLVFHMPALIVCDVHGKISKYQLRLAAYLKL